MHAVEPAFDLHVPTLDELLLRTSIVLYDDIKQEKRNVLCSKWRFQQSSYWLSRVFCSVTRVTSLRLSEWTATGGRFHFNRWSAVAQCTFSLIFNSCPPQQLKITSQFSYKKNNFYCRRARTCVCACVFESKLYHIYSMELKCIEIAPLCFQSYNLEIDNWFGFHKNLIIINFYIKTRSSGATVAHHIVTCSRLQWERCESKWDMRQKGWTLTLFLLFEETKSHTLSKK